MLLDAKADHAEDCDYEERPSKRGNGAATCQAYLRPRALVVFSARAVFHRSLLAPVGAMKA
jgi:hypothetical protein